VLVHCHSLGVEQITNYRNEVLLARAVAERGIPVFRYHARGHGDSAGNFADATLETMVEDALGAADHARRRAGADRVAWLGVRFGALVAAHALARRDDTAALALWEPVERGADYFRAMLRGVLMSQVARGKKPDASAEELMEAVERDGHVNVHGYYLHRAAVASAKDQELATALAGWSGPTYLAQIQSRRTLSPAHASLVTTLASRGAPVRTELITDEPGWHYVSNPVWLSEQLRGSTLEWLDALA
jgi:pimeloyl-ACP methyl ester carboxylesterase